MAGLKQDIIKDYWINRSKTYGKATVGYIGNSLPEQNKEYDEKINFVKQYLNKSLTTLDYGCGVGRWSILFDKYLGVDITNNLLEIAKKETIKEYLLIDTTYLPNYISKEFDFERFFTSTVLQHCDDDSVRDILKSIKVNKEKGFEFFLYENTEVQTNHVKGRTPIEYKKLISEYFEVLSFEEYHHMVHGEKHSITKINV